MQQFRLKERKKKRGTQGSSTVTLKSLCTFVDLSPFFHFSQFLCGSIAAPFIATGPLCCHPYIWMGEKSLNELLPHKMYSDEIKHVSSLILLQLLNSVRVFTKHSPPKSSIRVCVCAVHQNVSHSPCQTLVLSIEDTTSVSPSTVLWH